MGNFNDFGDINVRRFACSFVCKGVDIYPVLSVCERFKLPGYVGERGVLRGRPGMCGLVLRNC